MTAAANIPIRDLKDDIWGDWPQKADTFDQPATTGSGS